MNKELPNHRLLDIEFEISQCKGELTGLSHVIDEIEGGSYRVGRTWSLILHQVLDPTRLNSSTTSLTKVIHYQTSDLINSPRTTIKPSPTITNS